MLQNKGNVLDSPNLCNKTVLTKHISSLTAEDVGQLELLATSPGLPQAPMKEPGASPPLGISLQEGAHGFHTTVTKMGRLPLNRHKPTSIHPATAPETTAFAKRL